MVKMKPPPHGARGCGFWASHLFGFDKLKQILRKDRKSADAVKRGKRRLWYSVCKEGIAMYVWETILKTLETIEEHIGETIEIEGLAKTASLSPFYYQRLFSRLVKKPVREYFKLSNANIKLYIRINMKC
jgi:hypothetical protein